jgi:hypothetical protein
VDVRHTAGWFLIASNALEFCGYGCREVGEDRIDRDDGRRLRCKGPQRSQGWHTDEGSYELNGMEKVEEIASTAPVDDTEMWVAIDFEIALEQMVNWRDMLTQVWKAAIYDPKEMTVADVGKFSLTRNRITTDHIWKLALIRQRRAVWFGT